MTSITKNILYLVFVQGLIYLAPLVTLPYLTRVLSVPDFAALGFAQAVIQYFILITDYGFGITATRLIAINSRDKLAVSGVVANTLAVKLILSAAGGLACLLLIAVFADAAARSVVPRMLYRRFRQCTFPDLVISGLRENAGARPDYSRVAPAAFAAGFCSG
jgi:O-antigen/teichoic acid export membrane protein